MKKVYVKGIGNGVILKELKTIYIVKLTCKNADWTGVNWFFKTSCIKPL
jgi:hypothetical protein